MMGKSKSCSNLNLNEASSIFFWGLIALLFLLVIGNFILTMMIISYFKIGMGMESFKLIPEIKAIKFYGVTEFDKVYKKNGEIDGFRDSPITIESHSDFIKFNLVDRKGHNINRFIMGSNGTSIKNVNHISITDPDTKLPIFSSSKHSYSLEKSVRSLESNVIHTPEVVSPVEKDLLVESERQMIFNGIEGTSVEGKEVLFTADEHLTLNSTNGSIMLIGNNIHIDLTRIPIAPSIHEDYLKNDLEYKLCICMPKGALYRVPLSKLTNMEDACRQYDKNHFNPC